MRQRLDGVFWRMLAKTFVVSVASGGEVVASAPGAPLSNASGAEDGRPQAYPLEQHERELGSEHADRRASLT